MIDMFAEPFGVDKPQVLVVDDDADINRLLQVRLQNVGFAVRSADDGETALEEIRRQKPDVVLLDISMPGISGLDVLDSIRQDNLDIAVVMTTAFGSETVAVDALRRGADDYLRKPFESAEFRAVIDRTMSTLQLRRQNEQLRKQLNAELSRASQIQQSLLPDRPPEIDGYDIATVCEPAQAIGGHFFDWRQIDDGTLVFAFADVTGKGIPAALLMATVRASLRPAMKRSDPASAIEEVSEALSEDLMRTRSFVSMFLGSLDPREHLVRYIDAGHGLAVLMRADGTSRLLQGTDVPLGIFPDSRYQVHGVELAPGDTMIVYSDGLKDSLSDREMETLVSHTRGTATAMEAVTALINVAKSSDRWTDDVVIIALRRTEANSPE